MKKLCLLLLFGASAFAADPAITIYNQGFAVVRDSLPIELKAGPNQVTFTGATAKLEPDSPEFRRHRDRIVERCLPLADHIARRFDGRGEARDDLIQVARVGLVNAVIRYDVDTGSDFVSFAVPTIMGEVRRHFRDNSWSVKVPRRLKELHLSLGAATSELSQKLGRAPTASELAASASVARDARPAR
jgi:RNA polymerase sigma factor (sigma-70 family)